MSTQPLPIDEFAKRLRTKYPGAYDSLSDSQLVQKVVTKYPEYKEHIASFAGGATTPPVGVTDAYNPNAQKYGPAVRALDSIGGAVLGAPGAAFNAISHPIDTVKGIGSSLASYTDPKTRPSAAGVMSVLPEALGAGIGGYAAGEMGGAAPEAAAATKGALGTTLRTSEGALRPSVKALVHPTQIPAYLAEKLIPDRPTVPTYPGAPLPAYEDYAVNRGQEITGAMRQQPDAFAPQAAPNNPGAPLPSAEKFYEQRGNEISRAMRQQPDAFAPSPPEPPAVYPGAPLPSAEKFYETRGNEINRAMRQQPDAFAPPAAAAASAPELGSPENPGFMSKLPARLPPNLRGDPFSPTSPTASAPLGAIPSEEGVPGSLPKPSGRLVVLPQEAQALDQLQKIAKARASQHGMQYAAGMRPAGGGRVPVSPTGITTTEYPGPRLDPYSPISPEDLAALSKQLQ